MTDNPKQRITLHLVDAGNALDAPFAARARRALKALLRCYRLRCVLVDWPTEEPTKPQPTERNP